MKTRELTIGSMLCACAIILHMLESMIPLPIGIPFFRLGFANIAGLIALYLYGPKMTFSVNFIRVFFASLLRGTLFSTGFYLSLSGVFCATVIACIVYRSKIFTVYGISMLSGVFHAVGQMIAVTFIYQQFFMSALLPMLNLAALASGYLIGMLSDQVLKRWKGRLE